MLENIPSGKNEIAFEDRSLRITIKMIIIMTTITIMIMIMIMIILNRGITWLRGDRKFLFEC